MAKIIIELSNDTTLSETNDLLTEITNEVLNRTKFKSLIVETKIKG